jgi:hypothetical protein
LPVSLPESRSRRSRAPNVSGRTPPRTAVGFVNAVATRAIVAGTPLIGLPFSLPGDGRIGFAVLAAL